MSKREYEIIQGVNLMNYSLCAEIQAYLATLNRGCNILTQISETESELNNLHVVSETEYIGTLYTEDQYITKHIMSGFPLKPEVNQSAIRWFFISFFVFAVCILIGSSDLFWTPAGIPVSLLTFPSLICCVINGIRIIVGMIKNIPAMNVYKKNNEKYQLEKRKLQVDYQQYRAAQEVEQNRKRMEYRSNPVRFEEEYHKRKADLQNLITQLNIEKEQNEQRQAWLRSKLGIPLKYSDVASLKQLLDVIEAGRADSIKEAINVYEYSKELQKQTEYARMQAAFQYERMKQEQDNSQQVAEMLNQLQNITESDRKDAKRRGTEQCNNCKRYLTCSQKNNNDTGMCTGFIPTEKYLI